jgi:hypothetical protein
MTAKRLTLTALAGAFLCCAAVNTQPLSAQTNVDQTAPDNSAQNKNQPQTAEDQTNSYHRKDPQIHHG